VVRSQAADSARQVKPERPTVATHAGTVAPGILEIESGLEFDRLHGGNGGTLGPVVLKIGIGRRAQLSISGGFTRPPRESGGVGDASVGVKWRLVDDHPLLGDFAILPSVKLPAGSKASGRGTGTTDASLLLISSRALGPVSFDFNAGATVRSGDGSDAPRSATVWTFSFGGPIASGAGWTAELYGYPGTSGTAGSPPIVALLGGPTLQARPWLSFDAGVIVPLQGPQPRAAYFGMVYNAGRLWQAGH
jgi:hypothetical protein